ncbi:MAG: ATP/GTP-binding protein [bacterium]
MKIALIGTHGVGKTTLCFELAAKLKRLDVAVDLVKEVARGCPLPINRDTTLDAQSWILHAQCAQEIAAASASEIVVCDRSILDNYAYLVHALGRRPELDPWIRRWCGTYGALFKIPLWQPPRFDGTRDTDLVFQREVDETINALIRDFEVKVEPLDPNAPESWVERIVEKLGFPAQPPQRSLFEPR